MRIAFTLSMALCLCVNCTRHPDNDAALRVKIVGTWTTPDVTLPDMAQVKKVSTTFNPHGTWVTRYTITRSNISRTQATGGTWQIQNGIMTELQTAVDGITDETTKPGASQIVRLDGHEMLLSNYYSPTRVFLKAP